ncbi:hypothetical protein PDJAM_G00059790 [Pangasius djambal]|uniref:Uncharacterized protein n=1 Tax=Pangasius djambal TaxID=1691987 RepID=A0ACC5YXJ2_9TELE|nr:hypothetical protein [Pangasius djambal]
MIEHDPDLTAVVQELWDNDINRLRPGTDYRISLQNKAAYLSNLSDGKEAAGSPLFTYVDETIFKKETFLVDMSEFKEQLHRIWFELYARRGSSRPDSSGFEHVFVGETRGGHTVIGFHNWIQLYLQEKLGHIDYKGYSVKANSPEPDEKKHILALQFSWKNGIKPKGSIFVGVSPEFEFALYTLCFITSPNERVRVSFSLYDVEIVCHHYNQKHIGTTYPVLIRYQDVQ